MRRVWLSCCLPALLLLAACGQQAEPVEEPDVQYTRTVPEYTTGAASRAVPRVQFTDVTAASGIDFVHQTGGFGQRWMPETMGAGVGLFDVDGDGDDDAVYINGTWFAGHETPGQMPTSRLYANDGAGRFHDVTSGSGLDVSIYGMGVTAADYDADGNTDMFLTTLGPNLLLRGAGGMRFVDETHIAGVAGSTWRDDHNRDLPEWSTAALWADVDNDGWPDLFVTNYVHWSPENDLYASFDGQQKSYATPQQYPGSTPRLYRNRGDGTFEETTVAAGLLLPNAKSMGAASLDVDGDGWQDLVVTNDTQPNFLLRNQGGGHFIEAGMAAGIGYDESGRARAGMGVDVASLTTHESLAIGIGNFSRESMSLYFQTAPGSSVFLDGAGRSRLVQPTLRTLTFGLKFFDYDLDGYRDLLLANGHIEPTINAVQQEIDYAQAAQLFWNDGEGHLIDVGVAAGSPFAEPLVARGLAVGDLEQDGDVDALLSTNGGAARVLRNDAVGGKGGNALVLRLEGTAPAVDALGAVVDVVAAGRRQSLTVRTGSSYLSHHARDLVFGLGEAPSAAAVTVRWPDGLSQDLGSLSAGRYRVSRTQVTPLAKN
jgi:enediyne biosynthesis protein E4